MKKWNAFWHKGGTEVLGFMCTMPFIVVIVVMLISVAQVATINQTLQYSTYAACRAAVISDDRETAYERACLAAEFSFDTASSIYVPNSIKIPKSKFKVLNGQTANASDTANPWKKGNYLTCTVQVNVKSMTPFVNGKKSRTMVMMIERPVNTNLNSIFDGDT